MAQYPFEEFIKTLKLDKGVSLKVSSVTDPTGNNFVNLKNNHSIDARDFINAVEINEAVTIDYLEFSLNKKETRVIFEYLGSSGSLSERSMSLVSADGNSVVGMYPHRIKDSGLFNVLSYEDEGASGKYKFASKFPMHFPRGVRIRFENTGASTTNVAFALFGRSY